MNIIDLDAAIKAVCPIDGVSVGRANDKATWRIDFKKEATDEQRKAARDVVAAFDPSAPPLKTAQDKKIDALVAKGKLDPEVADLLR